MSEKNYYFVISIPRDELIEYSTKLGSYITKFFPGRTNPYILKPLEIQENNTIARITIRATEAEIREFADRFFASGYELRDKGGDEVEIARPSGQGETPPGRGDTPLH
ncbi:MAG: hypothetical protein KJ002_15060 [Candidatus Dadabacteria bacterium]|jgi:hypothetical protein|nr:hypothetical protein [Candidatus Dadabacteria bacterium]